MKKFLTMAIPVLPGQTNRVRNFVASLKGKYNKEYTELQKKYDVRERTFLQHNPDGTDLVIITLEGKDPQGLVTNWGKGTDAFSKYCVEEAKLMHGADFSSTDVQFPQNELLLDSEQVGSQTATR